MRQLDELDSCWFQNIREYAWSRHLLSLFAHLRVSAEVFTMILFSAFFYLFKKLKFLGLLPLPSANFSEMKQVVFNLSWVFILNTLFLNFIPFFPSWFNTPHNCSVFLSLNLTRCSALATPIEVRRIWPLKSASFRLFAVILRVEYNVTCVVRKKLHRKGCDFPGMFCVSSSV